MESEWLVRSIILHRLAIDPVTHTHILYVTEGGDESIGRSLAMPLILSDERLRGLIKDTLFGSFDMMNGFTAEQTGENSHPKGIVCCEFSQRSRKFSIHSVRYSHDYDASRERAVNGISFVHIPFTSTDSDTTI
jgi:hypothetical protein